MGEIIFILVTQLLNQTDQRIGFRVDSDGVLHLPDLPPGKTGYLRLSRILEHYRKLGSPDWTIRVLMDNKSTGIELDPRDVLRHTRILFISERNADGLDVLRVEGTRENWKDYILRLKYFGCMRNYFWDRRCRNQIPTNPRVATKLRFISRPDEAKRASVHRETGPRDDRPIATQRTTQRPELYSMDHDRAGRMDSFKYVFLFLVAWSLVWFAPTYVARLW